MRIGENARRCVIFFGLRGSEGIEYGGTGFFVDYRDNDLMFPYLVTARHVAEALSRHESFFLRANMLDGGASLIEVLKMRWACPEDPSVDLATTPFGLKKELMDHTNVNIPEILANFDDPRQICCGDS